MIAAGAVVGRVRRKLQITVGKLWVEGVKQGAVMEERVGVAALRVARDFAVIEREVGETADFQAGDGERANQSAKDEAVTGANVAQFRIAVERESQPVGQTAGGEDNGAPAGATADDTDAVGQAGGHAKFAANVAGTAEYDNRRAGFPHMQAEQWQARDNNMKPMSVVPYSRWRFETALPVDCLYTASHCWLREDGSGVWRVGLTGFAAWLLGDGVEYEFKVAPGTPVAAGQEIGWVEGLKAVQTIDAAVQGVFLGEGDTVRTDITVLQRDSYQDGWLYRARGTPVPGTLDVRGYAALLDAAVDAVKLTREAECGGECES